MVALVPDALIDFGICQFSSGRKINNTVEEFQNDTLVFQDLYCIFLKLESVGCEGTS